MPLDYAIRSTPVPLEPDSAKTRALQWMLIVLIMALNVALKAPNLGHETLKPMDESYHAVVARNLLYNPLKPTLIRDPYLPYDPTDWLANHVWLHKPILPLWQIAISFKLFGANTLALRLPSLILSTAAVLLTFLIARRVYDAWTGLIAALIQAITPAIGMLVHGYVFSDAIDISLLFWSELAIFLMLLERRGALLASGCAAGAAFLSKTFPALYVLAPLALVIWARRHSLSPYPGRGPGRGASGDESPDQNGKALSPALSQSTGRGREALAWLIGFLLIAAPWNIYIAIRFPTEFKAEHGLIIQHLSHNVENWASPWDRLWFQHLPGGMYLFWTTSIIGAIVLTIRAIQLRRWMWLFAPVWVAAVLIPFTLATSKTPSATLIAWPGLMICAGFLVARACRGFTLEFIVATTVLLLAVVGSGKFIQREWGMSKPFEIMFQAKWILWHLLISLTALGIALIFDRRRIERGWIAIPVGLLVVCLATRTARTSWRVKDVDLRQPSGAEVGRWIATQLPANAVIFIDERCLVRHTPLMFYANRSALPLSGQGATAQQLDTVRHNGGRPYLVRTPFHLPQFTKDDCCVYEIHDDNVVKHVTEGYIPPSTNKTETNLR